MSYSHDVVDRISVKTGDTTEEVRFIAALADDVTVTRDSNGEIEGDNTDGVAKILNTLEDRSNSIKTNGGLKIENNKIVADFWSGSGGASSYQVARATDSRFGKTTNTLNFANGSTFNGSAALTVNYESVAAASSAHTGVTGNNSQKGHVKLSDATDSTSGVNGGIAATPAAIKKITDGTVAIGGVKLGTKVSGATTQYGYYVGNDFKSFRQPTGNAASSDVLSGKTFANASSDAMTGSMSTKAAATYNTSTSDQSIAAGQYLSGKQTIKAVTTSGIDAANIKSGTVVKVGDANSATRIKNVTGTFTKSNTVSSGQISASRDNILKGFSAWVDGAEVKGSIDQFRDSNFEFELDSEITEKRLTDGYYQNYKIIANGSAICTQAWDAGYYQGAIQYEEYEWTENLTGSYWLGGSAFPEEIKIPICAKNLVSITNNTGITILWELQKKSSAVISGSIANTGTYTIPSDIGGVSKFTIVLRYVSSSAIAINMNINAKYKNIKED